MNTDQFDEGYWAETERTRPLDPYTRDPIRPGFVYRPQSSVYLPTSDDLSTDATTTEFSSLQDD